MKSPKLSSNAESESKHSEFDQNSEFDHNINSNQSKINNHSEFKIKNFVQEYDNLSIAQTSLIPITLKKDITLQAKSIFKN